MIFLAFLLLYVVAAPTTLLAPSADSFYTSPSNVSQYAAGSVIKMRPAPAQLLNYFFSVNVKSTYQIMYRSSDSFGNANVAVATLVEPYSADSSKLLSYQIFEDASSIDCSPSYQMIQAQNDSNTDVKIEMFFIEAALDQGWYVVLPDYEGLKSTFTAGRQEGHATLDGIRAALSANGTGLNSSADIALWGYSGGSIATGFAASLAPTYAPELNLIGAAIGGFVTNITSVARNADGNSNIGLTAMSLRGLANEYDDFATVLYQHLLPDKVSLFNKTQLVCLSNYDEYFTNQSFFSGSDPWFDDGWNFFDLPESVAVLDDVTLGTNSTEMPDIPVFIYHGEQDTTVPYEYNAVSIFNTWKNWGIKSLEFASDESTNHTQELFLGGPAALAWLRKRFEGVAAVSGAVHTSRPSNLLYPGVDASVVEIFDAAAKSAVGAETGPFLEVNLDVLLLFNEY